MASLRSNRTSTKPERVMPVRLLRKLAMTAEINSITRRYCTSGLPVRLLTPASYTR